MAVSLIPDKAIAQPQARTIQFLFVIDDSGSMSGRNATDPDRLAIFSVQAILSMLDDRDEVSLLRLNGDPAEDSDIQPLSRNREQMQARLALDAPMAAYKGQWTPCRSALERATNILNRAYEGRTDVYQVVMFLTDGACEPAGQRPDPTAFLRGVKSQQDRHLQFYLLRFAGREVSAELGEIATTTGGTSIEVGQDDPYRILYPFATALSRSQGYEAYVLSTRDTVLKAHHGARRIRLLAIAQGEGGALQVRLDRRSQGALPEIMGRPRFGVHQYQSGNRFRFTAVDYAPGEGESVVSVGGSENWHVIVFPEYRLVADLKVKQGSCGRETEAAHSVDIGGDICARLNLLNDQGQPVSDLGNDAAGFIDLTLPDGRVEHIGANREGKGLAFTMERRRLEKIAGATGDSRYRLTPKVRLTFPDHQAVELGGPAWDMEVSSSEIRCEPSVVNAGELVPGTDVTHAFSCDGNFAPISARLVVQDASSLPPCLRFDVNGKAEGIPITSGQPLSLGIHADTFCGASFIDRKYDVSLRLEFARADSQLPSQGLRVALKLNSRFECAFRPVEITGGTQATVELACQTNAARDSEFVVFLPALDKAAKGSEDEHLAMGFGDDDGRIRRDESGNALSQVNYKLSAAGSPAPLRLVVAADGCCGDSESKERVLLLPKGPNYQASDRVELPLKVTTRSAGLWSCWGKTILRVLGILLLVLLVLYAFNMFRQSHFFSDVDGLAKKIRPLEWTMGGVQFIQKRQAAVQDEVRRRMRWKARIINWLRANPLVFGLPGRQFVETVSFSPTGSPEPAQGLAMNLVPRAFRRDEVRKSPASFRGQLFADASGGGVSFFGVPTPPAGLMGALCPEETIGIALQDSDGCESETPKMKTGISNLCLVKKLDLNERVDGDFAGWRFN